MASPAASDPTQARRSNRQRAQRKAKEPAARQAAPNKPRRPRAAKAPTAEPAEESPGAPSESTLCIDIGGEGIKMLVVGPDGVPVSDRCRELTPHPSEPSAILSVIRHMAQTQPVHHRVSCGFPGVIVHGVVRSAPNLGTSLWQGFPLEASLAKLLCKPTRAINDADLQGHGVIHGQGVELVLTLGTGVGSALFINGCLIPNLELGHHPFEKGRTYEQRLSNAELRKIGKKRWNRRVERALARLSALFCYDRLHLGGGNARRLQLELPENTVIFTNVDGLVGGCRLWDPPLSQHPDRVSTSATM